MDGLANFGVDYDSDANSLTFKNGEAEIKKITLNSDPSAEWTTALWQDGGR